MPDSRHVILANDSGPTGPRYLYLADTRTEKFELLSRDTSVHRLPAVSPDGRKLVFLAGPEGVVIELSERH